jgi:hypothetical protein
MSTHTPHLSKAYNWLVFAKGMHQQLVDQQQQCAPVTTEKPSSCSVPSVVSPSASEVSYTAASTATNTSMDSSSSSMMMTVEQTTVPVVRSNSSGDSSDDDDVVVEESNLEDDGVPNSLDELTEVIFYSHTYTGDGFEVMPVDDSSNEIEYHPATSHGDNKDDDDDDHHFVNNNWISRILSEEDDDSASFVVVDEDDEEEDGDISDPAMLVLTESLDEDGFEVSYATDFWNVNKNFNDDCRLSSLLASPRDVAY